YLVRRHPPPPLALPYTTLFRSIPYAAVQLAGVGYLLSGMTHGAISFTAGTVLAVVLALVFALVAGLRSVAWTDSLQAVVMILSRSEEHTSELQSRFDLVCRLLL